MVVDHDVIRLVYVLSLFEKSYIECGLFNTTASAKSREIERKINKLKCFCSSFNCLLLSENLLKFLLLATFMPSPRQQ